MLIQTTDVTIPASDGYELTGSLFEPSHNHSTPTKPPDAIQLTDELVIINSATSVRRQFYSAFAKFLVESGYRVITYDYRGIGDSRPKSLRGFDAKFQDWGLLDMNGVVEWTTAAQKPTRLIIVGHSVGGQLMGMIPAREKIDAMVTTSAQSGYWRMQGGREKLNVLFTMTVLFPLLSRLFGYFPWSKFRAGEDLPKGVAMEWAKWCRDPNYLLGDRTLPLERYATFSAPVLAYSFDDDNWGTEASVDAMMKAYPNLTRRHVVRSDFDVKSIGHFGFYRTKSKLLWEDAVHWLQGRSSDK